MKIILESYMRIGDRVRMAMDPTARDWGGANAPSNGTEGTVVKFNTRENFYSRTECWIWAPGKYRSVSGAEVMWDTGAVTVPSAHDLEFVDASLEEIRRQDTAWNKEFDTPIRIGDLPELPYCELDIVELIDRKHRHFGSPYVKIETINYDWLGEFCNDGVTPYPIYQCSAVEGRQGTMVFGQDSFKRIHKRGLFWVYENDRDKLAFKDLNEEAQFFSCLGYREELRNPTTSNYAWTKDEALEFIREGKADCFTVGGALLGFGTGGRVSVYAFSKLPELGARLRAETIKGFAGEVP